MCDVTSCGTDEPADPLATVFRRRTEAEAYVESVCFRHGPPELVGVELEWTVHHATDPGRALDPGHLADALGQHTPKTLSPDSPELPLPGGTTLTLEPGGQVEISTPPQPSLTSLFASATEDIEYLTTMLGRAGLVCGTYGTDAHRRPHRLLHTARYDAMERAFSASGSHGVTMMCSTAAIQVCVDVGRCGQSAQRWSAIHALGPVLVAAFANSPRSAGSATGWASSRLRSVLGIGDARARPGPPKSEPVRWWTSHALDVPLLCVRNSGASWDAPRGISFADWIDGALPGPPTAADLDYHLSTLFPPVRPRGHYEIRYLDAQPLHSWFTPVALLSVLLDSDASTNAALEICEPVADQWVRAARRGLADAELAHAATRVFELGGEALERSDLDSLLTAEVRHQMDRTLHNNRGGIS